MARALVSCSLTHVLHAPALVVQPSELANLPAQRDALSHHAVTDGHPTLFYGAAPVLGLVLPTRPAQGVPLWHEVGIWVLRPLLRRLPPWNLSPRMLCVVCAPCKALRGVCLAVSGLVRSDASTPCSLCPEVCDCSSFALSTAGGGVSSYHHLSVGEALWYTTCALLALPAPCLRFAPHSFFFVVVSCSHTLIT